MDRLVLSSIRYGFFFDKIFLGDYIDRVMSKRLEDQKTAFIYTIGFVSKRTGLKPDLIRAWERRHGAIAPNRSETGRRLYADKDIERLLLLDQAVKNGHRIGQAAKLPNEALRTLIADAEAVRLAREAASTPLPAREPAKAAQVVTACVQAVRRLDPEELERLLESAAIHYSRIELLEEIAAPLIEKVGELWRVGELRPVHEHLTTSAMRTFIANMRGASADRELTPTIVIATPAGQVHELGALLAAACASAEGWRVTYLGPDLPAEEIAAAIEMRQARAAALSVVYPQDDPRLARELERLARMVGTGVSLIVGGRGAAAYQATLDRIGADRADSLGEMRDLLEELRMPRRSATLAPFPANRARQQSG